MEPRIDEIIVLALLRSFPEVMMENLKIFVKQEAYGPSRNEGLCYESCSVCSFEGEVNGSIYFCLDGYTKMKLLPRIARRFRMDAGVSGMADSIMLEFANQTAAGLLNELVDGGFDIRMLSPENMNHKMVPIDLQKNRQYIIIFFLLDRREKEYLGRVYLVLTLHEGARTST